MTWPIFSPLLVTRCWNPQQNGGRQQAPSPEPPDRPGAPTSSPQKGLQWDQGAPMPELQELPLTALTLGRATEQTQDGGMGGAGSTHNSVIDIRE